MNELLFLTVGQFLHTLVLVALASVCVTWAICRAVTIRQFRRLITQARRVTDLADCVLEFHADSYGIGLDDEVTR